MNAILGQVLSSVLGDYVMPEGLRTLRVTGLAETVELSDLIIKPEAIDSLDLPLKIVYGAIKSVRMRIPGGATRILGSLFTGSYTDSIQVSLDGIYVLVDTQTQTPTEAARKHASVKKSSLDFDVNEYRQALLAKIYASLERASATSADAPARATTTLVESITNNLQLSVNNFHVRYEDFTSQAGRPFAAGITFAHFSTRSGAADNTGTRSPAPLQKSGLQHRFASLSFLAVYWDPLTSVSESATGSTFTAMLPSSRSTVQAAAERQARLNAAFRGGIHGSDTPGAARHEYLLQPEPAAFSPAVRLAVSLNGGGRVAGEPKLRARLDVAWLRMGLEQRQWHGALLLQARLQGAAYRALHREVAARHPRPTAAPAAAPAAWWHFAAHWVRGIRSRQAGGGGTAAATTQRRWDFGRVSGSLERRERYVAAYRAQLAAEHEAMDRAARSAFARGGSGDAAGLDLSEAGSRRTREALAALEADPALLYEQALQYRAEVRVAFERDKLAAPAASGAEAKRGGGGGGWLGSLFGSASAAPKALADNCPADVNASAAAASGLVQAAYQRSLHGAAGAEGVVIVANVEEAVLALRRDDDTSLRPLPSADAAASGVGGSDPAAIMTIQCGCAVRFATAGSAVRLQMQLAGLRATDGATRGTAYPVILQQRSSSGSLPFCGSRGGMDNKDVVPAETSKKPARSSASVPTPPPLVHLELETTPGSPDGDYRVLLRAQPLLAVFAPACLRALAAFAAFPAAAAVATGVAAQLSALGARTATDAYAALAMHKKIQLDAAVAGPIFVLPANVADASGARLLVHLGDLSVRSMPTSALLVDDDGEGEGAGEGEGVGADCDGIALAPATSAVRSLSAPSDASLFDTWSLRLADVCAYMQQREPPQCATAATACCADLDLGVHLRPTRAAIEPITLAVALQTSILPSEHAPNRARLRASLPRVCVRLGLDLLLHLGVLRRQVTGLIFDVAADAEATQTEYAATLATNKAAARSRSIRSISARSVARGVASSAGAVAANDGDDCESFHSAGSEEDAEVEEGNPDIAIDTDVREDAAALLGEAPIVLDTDSNAHSTAVDVASSVADRIGAELVNDARSRIESQRQANYVSSPVSMLPGINDGFTPGSRAPAASSASVVNCQLLMAYLSVGVMELDISDVRLGAQCAKAAGSSVSLDALDAVVSRARLTTAGEENEVPDLQLSLRGLRIKTGLSLAGANVAVTLQGVRIADAVQRAGSGFEYLVDSSCTGSGIGLGAPFIDLAATYSAPKHCVAGEAPITLVGQFSALHMNYNATTMTSIEFFGMFAIRCAADWTASTSISSSSVAHAAAPGVKDFSYKHLDTLFDSVASPSGTAAIGAPETVTSARTQLAIRVSLVSITLSLNKESIRRRVALVGIKCLSLTLVDSTAETSITAALSDIIVLDTSSADALRPYIVCRANSVEILQNKESAQLLAVRAVIRKAGGQVPLEVDGTLTVVLKALTLNYSHAAVTEIIDYAMTGMLGGFVSAAAESAGSAIVHQAKSAAKYLLDIEVAALSVIVPASVRDSNQTVASFDRLVVANRFIVDTIVPDILSRTNEWDVLEIVADGVTIGTNRWVVPGTAVAEPLQGINDGGRKYYFDMPGITLPPAPVADLLASDLVHVLGGSSAASAISAKIRRRLSPLAGTPSEPAPRSLPLARAAAGIADISVSIILEAVRMDISSTQYAIFLETLRQNMSAVPQLFPKSERLEKEPPVSRPNYSNAAVIAAHHSSEGSAPVHASAILGGDSLFAFPSMALSLEIPSEISFTLHSDAGPLSQFALCGIAIDAAILVGGGSIADFTLHEVQALDLRHPGAPQAVLSRWHGPVVPNHTPAKAPPQIAVHVLLGAVDTAVDIAVCGTLATLKPEFLQALSSMLLPSSAGAVERGSGDLLKGQAAEAGRQTEEAGTSSSRPHSRTSAVVHLRDFVVCIPTSDAVEAISESPVCTAVVMKASGEVKVSMSSGDAPLTASSQTAAITPRRDVMDVSGALIDFSVFLSRGVDILAFSDPLHVLLPSTVTASCNQSSVDGDVDRTATVDAGALVIRAMPAFIEAIAAVVDRAGRSFPGQARSSAATSTMRKQTTLKVISERLSFSWKGLDIALLDPNVPTCAVTPNFADVIDHHVLARAAMGGVTLMCGSDAGLYHLALSSEFTAELWHPKAAAPLSIINPPWAVTWGLKQKRRAIETGSAATDTAASCTGTNALQVRVSNGQLANLASRMAWWQSFLTRAFASSPTLPVYAESALTEATEVDTSASAVPNTVDMEPGSVITVAAAATSVESHMSIDLWLPSVCAEFVVDPQPGPALYLAGAPAVQLIASGLRIDGGQRTIVSSLGAVSGSSIECHVDMASARLFLRSAAADRARLACFDIERVRAGWRQPTDGSAAGTASVGNASARDLRQSQELEGRRAYWYALSQRPRAAATLESSDTAAPVTTLPLLSLEIAMSPPTAAFSKSCARVRCKLDAIDLVADPGLAADVVATCSLVGDSLLSAAAPLLVVDPEAIARRQQAQRLRREQQLHPASLMEATVLAPSIRLLLLEDPASPFSRVLAFDAADVSLVVSSEIDAPAVVELMDGPNADEGPASRAPVLLQASTMRAGAVVGCVSAYFSNMSPARAAGAKADARPPASGVDAGENAMESESRSLLPLLSGRLTRVLRAPSLAFSVHSHELRNVAAAAAIVAGAPAEALAADLLPLPSFNAPRSRMGVRVSASQLLRLRTGGSDIESMHRLVDQWMAAGFTGSSLRGGGASSAAMSPPSTLDSPVVLPDGWHPDDYSVALPFSVARFLLVYARKPAVGASKRSPLFHVALSAAAAAADTTAPAADAAAAETAASAKRLIGTCIRDGDALLAVNASDASLMTEMDVLAALRGRLHQPRLSQSPAQAAGAVLLRLRAMRNNLRVDFRHGIEVTVVDGMSGGLRPPPLARATLTMQAEAGGDWSSSSTAATLDVTAGVDVFHPRSRMWEPVLEHTLPARICVEAMSSSSGGGGAGGAKLPLLVHAAIPRLETAICTSWAPQAAAVLAVAARRAGNGGGTVSQSKAPALSSISEAIAAAVHESVVTGAAVLTALPSGAFPLVVINHTGSTLRLTPSAGAPHPQTLRRLHASSASSAAAAALTGAVVYSAVTSSQGSHTGGIHAASGFGGAIVLAPDEMVGTLEAECFEVAVIFAEEAEAERESGAGLHSVTVSLLAGHSQHSTPQGLMLVHTAVRGGVREVRLASLLRVRNSTSVPMTLSVSAAASGTATSAAAPVEVGTVFPGHELAVPMRFAGAAGKLHLAPVPPPGSDVRYWAEPILLTAAPSVLLPSSAIGAAEGTTSEVHHTLTCVARAGQAVGVAAAAAAPRSMTFRVAVATQAAPGAAAFGPGAVSVRRVRVTPPVWLTNLLPVPVAFRACGGGPTPETTGGMLAPGTSAALCLPAFPPPLVSLAALPHADARWVDVQAWQWSPPLSAAIGTHSLQLPALEQGDPGVAAALEARAATACALPPSADADEPTEHADCLSLYAWAAVWLQGTAGVPTACLQLGQLGEAGAKATAEAQAAAASGSKLLFGGALLRAAKSAVSKLTPKTGGARGEALAVVPLGALRTEGSRRGDQVSVPPVAAVFIRPNVPVHLRLASSAIEEGGAWAAVGKDGDWQSAVSHPSLSLHGEGGDHRWDLVASTTAAAYPFVRTRVLTVAPRYRLLNATGAPLRWRQAGETALGAEGSLVAAWSRVPLFWTGTPLAAPTPSICVAPAAACGAWSPAVPALLPSSGAEQSFPLLLPLPAGAGGGGGGIIRTPAGPTPAASLVLCVAVKPDPEEAGATLVVVTLQGGGLLRPPCSVIPHGSAIPVPVAVSGGGDVTAESTSDVVPPLVQFHNGSSRLLAYGLSHAAGNASDALVCFVPPGASVPVGFGIAVVPADAVLLVAACGLDGSGAIGVPQPVALATLHRRHRLQPAAEGDAGGPDVACSVKTFGHTVVVEACDVAPSLARICALGAKVAVSKTALVGAASDASTSALPPRDAVTVGVGSSADRFEPVIPRPSSDASIAGMSAGAMRALLASRGIVPASALSGDIVEQLRQLRMLVTALPGATGAAGGGGTGHSVSSLLAYGAEVSVQLTGLGLTVVDAADEEVLRLSVGCIEGLVSLPPQAAGDSARGLLSDAPLPLTASLRVVDASVCDAWPAAAFPTIFGPTESASAARLPLLQAALSFTPAFGGGGTIHALSACMRPVHVSVSFGLLCRAGRLVRDLGIAQRCVLGVGSNDSPPSEADRAPAAAAAGADGGPPSLRLSREAAVSLAQRGTGTGALLLEKPATLEPLQIFIDYARGRGDSGYKFGDGFRRLVGRARDSAVAAADGATVDEASPICAQMPWHVLLLLRSGVSLVRLPLTLKPPPLPPGFLSLSAYGAALAEKLPEQAQSQMMARVASLLGAAASVFSSQQHPDAAAAACRHVRLPRSPFLLVTDARGGTALAHVDRGVGSCPDSWVAALGGGGGTLDATHLPGGPPRETLRVCWRGPGAGTGDAPVAMARLLEAAALLTGDAASAVRHGGVRPLAPAAAAAQARAAAAAAGSAAASAHRTAAGGGPWALMALDAAVAGSFAALARRSPFDPMLNLSTAIAAIAATAATAAAAVEPASVPAEPHPNTTFSSASGGSTAAASASSLLADAVAAMARVRPDAAPRDNLGSLVRCLCLVAALQPVAAAAAASASKAGEAPEAGADDLVPVFYYAVAHARVAHPALCAVLMQVWLTDQAAAAAPASGQEQYALASFQCACVWAACVGEAAGEL